MNDDPIIEVDGTEFPEHVYEETSKAVGTQQEVADWWAEGKLPTHETWGNSCVLRSKTANFRGKQFPDGHGELWHYQTIEAWRTPEGLVISNTECFARGRARCNSPRNNDANLPLTTLRHHNALKEAGVELNDITNVKRVSATTVDGRSKDAKVVTFKGVDDKLIVASRGNTVSLKWWNSDMGMTLKDGVLKL